MARTDPRRLSPPAQEDLRRRVVYVVAEDGMGESALARAFGVSRRSIDSRFDGVDVAGSVHGLDARKRGPKPRPLPPAAGERKVWRLMCKHCPDQLRPPFSLWYR